MGYELRRWLREAMGPEVPPGLSRLVAYEIADDASDETRLSFADLADLCRWTGAKDTKAVRDALLRLGKAGWEFRVPMGTGSDGRVVYAAKRHALDFLVPRGRRVEGSDGLGSDLIGPSEFGPMRSSKGRTHSSKGRTQSPKGRTQSAPSPQVSSGPLNLSRPGLSVVAADEAHTRRLTDAEQALRAAGMTDEREIIECTKWITELHRVRSQRWWRSLPSQDVQEHIAAWRAQRTPAAPSVPPWCGECGDGEPAARTNLRFRRAEGAPCPRCHPDALQESA